MYHRAQARCKAGYHLRGGEHVSQGSNMVVPRTRTLLEPFRSQIFSGAPEPPKKPDTILPPCVKVVMSTVTRTGPKKYNNNNYIGYIVHVSSSAVVKQTIRFPHPAPLTFGRSLTFLFPLTVPAPLNHTATTNRHGRNRRGFFPFLGS